jgi:antitoxin (DNA-binding transcriptional repressor) of toxin-antitoxin stability system
MNAISKSLNKPLGVPNEVRVGVRELRGKLTEYLRAASLGKSVLVTSHDTVIAEIRAPSLQTQTPREPGALRGQIRMSDDFDTWPADVLAAMEG